VHVNVRVLCATHRNLERMVVDGGFREDLYYRLNVLNVSVPALRERGTDILLLAEHFLRQACTQIQRPPCRLAVATHLLLLGNRWSGNVRQLQNVIFRAAAICEGEVIDCDGLELAGTALVNQQAETTEVSSLEAAMQDYERSLLERFYADYPSTRQLAQRLQTSHTAIGQRLRKYGIS
jgi:TyrR family helix-turn-helix protein